MRKEVKKVNNKKEISTIKNNKEKCPRCGSTKPELGALSRRSDVYICSECGREEALIDVGYMDMTLTEKKFLVKLGLTD